MDTQWAILFSMEAHATPATITLRAGDGGIRPASVTWEPRDELNTRQEPAVALVRLATPFRGQLHMELSGKLSWTDAGCALAAQYELVESTTLGPPPSYPADSLSIASRLTPDNELTWCPGTVTRVQHFVTGPGSRVR
ncbi:MAG: hypothetical protein HY904_07670 [Deltaproteobacteria bacterium]|nr:hypothetical protein [Deltaproteobacteria bacterium]